MYNTTTTPAIYLIGSVFLILFTYLLIYHTL